MDIKFTNHAIGRVRQRGIPSGDVDLMLRFGARSVTHKACELVTLGRSGANELLGEGVSAQVIDRLKRTALVVSSRDGALVTALKLRGGKRRRYLHQH